MNESYFWVMRAIEGSKTEWHFEACQVLIDLFYKKYGDFHNDMIELQTALDKKILTHD